MRGKRPGWTQEVREREVRASARREESQVSSPVRHPVCWREAEQKNGQKRRPARAKRGRSDEGEARAVARHKALVLSMAQRSCGTRISTDISDDREQRGTYSGHGRERERRPWRGRGPAGGVARKTRSCRCFETTRSKYSCRHRSVHGVLAAGVGSWTEGSVGGERGRQG